MFSGEFAFRRIKGRGHTLSSHYCAAMSGLSFSTLRAIDFSSPKGVASGAGMEMSAGRYHALLALEPAPRARSNSAVFRRAILALSHAYRDDGDDDKGVDNCWEGRNPPISPQSPILSISLSQSALARSD